MAAKFGWTFVATASLLVGLCYRWGYVPGNSVEGITINQTQFSVTADPGTELVMIYVPLTNHSNTEDRLVGLKSSCECVTTADLPHEVLPGESWNLPLRIDASKCSPGNLFVFDLTLFLESGSAVPVQIDFMVAEGQSSHSFGSDEGEL